MIAFVSGVLATLLLPHLPSLSLTWLAAFVTSSLLVLSHRRRHRDLKSKLQYQLLWLLAGLIFGVLQGHWRVASIIPAPVEQQDVALTGFISGLPQCSQSRGQSLCQFTVEVITARWRDQSLALKRIQLSQYGVAEVQAGGCIAATVRLKRPHGLFNAGSIDFETAKLRAGIDATGYVRALRDEACAGDVRWLPVRAIAMARVAIRNAVLAHFSADANAGLVLALLLGDYSLVDRQQWVYFNATGTQHLVTVSGLHIGIAAMLGYGLGSFLCLPLRSSARRQQGAAVGAWLVAFVYALLAGDSTPTVRSLLMLSLFLLMRLRRRESSVGAALWAAFAAIVIADPLAATAVGFWLSFGAVAVLVVGLQWRRQRQRFIESLVAPQWVVFVGLAPLLLACFGQLPPVSMLANLLAVPWSSFVIMPVLLLGTVCGFALPALNTLLAATLEYLCRWLMWCRDLPIEMLMLPASAPIVSMLVLILAAVFLLLPRGLWLRPQALLLLGALLLAAVDDEPMPDLTLDVFDVGQGLSVLIGSRGHHLLFDTGAAWGDDFDAAQISVLPFLRSRGISALDLLMVSHADMDHAGGVGSVLDNVAVGAIFAGEPILAAPAAQRCVSGQHWSLGGAQLTVLYPPAGAPTPATAILARNNASCVLLVDYRGRRLLLTGDIEAGAERTLLADPQASQLLAGGVDVVVAPHHGSRSSSTPEFVRLLHPAHVVFAAGYRNRYGHPHPVVVARYQQQGSVIHRSDRDGMVRFRVDSGGELQVIRWRQRWLRYWFLDDA